MKCLRPLTFGAWLIAAALPALAVDTETTPATPDLTVIRARIEAKDFKAAIAGLNVMVEQGERHADVYNLLGYSLRKSGDPKTALTYYCKALDFDPDHKGALEYLGELYVEMGEMAKAEENRARLAQLCPEGCEELDDLVKAMAEAKTN